MASFLESSYNGSGSENESGNTGGKSSLTAHLITMDESEDTDDSFDEQTEESLVSALDFTEKTWKDNVTFIVEGKHLYAAKNVLAMVSPVFESMFSSSFKEKDQDEIELPGKKFDDFKEFLHCMYPTSTKPVNEDNVFLVLPLADEYQVSSLKKRCGEALRKHLTEDIDQMSASKTLKCYILGKKYGITGIRDICVKEMCRQGKLELGEEDVADVDKDSLLEYQNNMFAHFGKVYTDLHTKYVKSLMGMSSKLDEAENVPDFENSVGTTLELTIENVFELSVNEQQFSKQVSLWNANFKIKAFISDESKKFLAVYLVCELPERDKGWSCKVNYIICMKVLGEKSEKTVESYKTSHDFTQKSYDWGYKKFRKLSGLIEDLSFRNDAGGTSVKIVVHLLANKPVKAE